MGRKSESTNEKIVRMYKEGMRIEAIADELKMPRDNVPKILEKYMPDYLTYQPQAKNGNTKENKPKKGGLLGAFKKDKVNKDNHNHAAENSKAEPVAESKPTHKKTSNKTAVNLAINDDGEFYDGVVRGIAKMLQNGKDVATIAEFFNRDEDDIIAVRKCMNERFKQNGNDEEKAKEEVTEDKSGYVSLTGLDDGNGNNVMKHKYNAPQEDYTSSEEMPSIDPLSLDELDKQIEAMDVHHVDEDVEDIPAAVPIETPTETEEAESEEPEAADTAEDIAAEDNLQEEPVQPEEPAEDEEISADDNDADEVTPEEDDTEPEETSEELTAEEITFDEEDESMSPMEKMKKFAEKQIEMNNKKIEELEAKKAETAKDAETADEDIENAKASIEKNNSKIEQLNNDIEENGDRLSQLRKEIEELENKQVMLREDAVSLNEKNEELNEKITELESKKSSVDSAVAELDEEIESIKKENAEFASFGG